MLALILLCAAVALGERCDLACTREWDPVCGTDVKTYGNSCEMRVRNCLTRGTVKAAYEGQCFATCPDACTMEYDPVCADNGITYGNDCEMSAYGCMTRMALVAEHRGECNSPVGKIGLKEAQTGCNLACTLDYNPICGSDGKTYGNACELDSISCLSKNNVKVAHAGEC